MSKKITLKELRRSKSGIFDEKKCISMTQLSDALWKLNELGDDSAMLKILKMNLDRPLFLFRHRLKKDLNCLP